jgi:glycosyltransferase involved in cell wall biosynthesis
VRVGLVNGNPDWGGGERWFRDAAAALAHRGHDLTLVAGAGTRLLEEFRRTGHPTADLDGIGSALATHRPEIVLVNSGRDLRRVLRECGRRPSFRLAFRRGIDRPLRNNLVRRRDWKRLSAILVNSDATGWTVRRSLPWFPVDRIRRIYNPVSLSPARRVEAARGPYRFGAAGRLVRQKGFDRLLEAFAAVSTSIDATLEIAGEGKERPRLERLRRKLRIEDSCRLAGPVDDMASFYARIDAIVMPSLYEGFGFVAVEAALAGLPVVATDVSSLVEVVADGQTGYLVPSDDVPALTEAMMALATSEDRGRGLGAEARRRALERFDPRALHDELEGFLRDAVSLPAVGDA